MPSTPDRQKAIAYVRASTDEQALSPEVQQAEILGYCEPRGVELVDVIVEHRSGKLAPEQRPGVGLVLERARELGAGLVVVQRRDRIARHVGHARSFVDSLARLGVRVVTADGIADEDTPTARLLATLLDTVAEFEEFEGEQITTCTRGALRALQARGRLVGSAPYGTEAGGQTDGGDRPLVTSEGEAAAVRRAVELHAAKWSLRRIAEQLTIEATSLGAQPGIPRPFAGCSAGHASTRDPGLQVVRTHHRSQAAARGGLLRVAVRPRLLRSSGRADAQVLQARSASPASNASCDACRPRSGADRTANGSHRPTLHATCQSAARAKSTNTPSPIRAATASAKSPPVVLRHHGRPASS